MVIPIAVPENLGGYFHHPDAINLSEKQMTLAVKTDFGIVETSKYYYLDFTANQNTPYFESL